MNQKRTSLEIIAPSVEEAIDKGLQDLGIPRGEVEVEVLDEGSRGLFGLGSRQARIRITVKSTSSQKVEEKAEESDQPPAEERVEIDLAPEPQEEPTEDEDYILRVARETVAELLDKMRVTAEVTSYYGERDEPRSRTPFSI